MKKEKIMSLSIKDDSDEKTSAFYEMMMQNFITWEYDDINEVYHLVSDERRRRFIKPNTQIGRYLRKAHNGMLLLNIVEYSIKDDDELLKFIKDNFNGLHEYLKDTQDYNIQIGIGRKFFSYHMEEPSREIESSGFHKNLEIKRILAILYLVRKINHGYDLDNYSKVLALSMYVIDRIISEILDKKITMHNMVRIIDGNRVTLLPLILEDEVLVTGLSQCIINECREVKFCKVFIDIINRNITTIHFDKMFYDD